MTRAHVEKAVKSSKDGLPGLRFCKCDALCWRTFGCCQVGRQACQDCAIDGVRRIIHCHHSLFVLGRVVPTMVFRVPVFVSPSISAPVQLGIRTCVSPPGGALGAHRRGPSFVCVREGGIESGPPLCRLTAEANARQAEGGVRASNSFIFAWCCHSISELLARLVTNTHACLSAQSW